VRPQSRGQSTSVEAERSAGEEQAADGKAGVFLSYAREDVSFALRLHGALRAQGREVWTDWEDIPAGVRWEAEIATGIEAADVFVLVLSPDSVGSNECEKELRRACDHNKRLVAVLYRDVEPDEAPEVLRPLQWSDLRNEATFERDFERLSEAFDTDFGWMREHTRLLERALEWERASRDGSRLLRGGDLAEAERWLTQQGTGGGRKPTDLQTEYIFASRGAVVRRQRVTVVAVLLALAVAVALAVFALIQRSDAIARAKVARSRELAARSLLQLPVDPAESVRLAVDAARAEPTAEAERALRRSLSVPAVGVVVERQSSPLRAVAFSTDGKLVVTAGEDGKTRVRKIATGALVALLDNRSIELVDSVSFSRDGRFLLAMGESVAWAWDTKRWKRIAALDEGFAQAAAVAPDGRLFFSTRGLTRVWDPATGRTTVALEEESLHGSFAFPPAFSPDGDLVVSLSGRSAGAALVWEPASHRILAVLRGTDDDEVTSAAFSPDGKLIVTADIAGVTRVWRARTGRLVAVLRGESGANTAAFSPDGKLVLTSPGTARLWDLQRRRIRRVLGDPRTNGTRAAVFSPDGRLVVTAGANGARVWDARTGATVALLRGHTGIVNGAAFTRDGTLIVTAGEDGQARLWRVPRSARVPLPGPAGAPAASGPDFSPDGKLVATPGKNGEARIWDARTGRLVRSLNGHQGAVTSVRFSADGKRLVTGGVDATVRAWEVADGKALAIMRPRTGAVAEATFSPDGTRILTVSRSGSARLWDAATGRSVAVLPGQFGTFGGAQFSPEGDLVVTYGGADGAARVSDARSGRSIAVVGDNDNEVLGAALGPDRRLLAAGLPAVGARVLDLKTKKRLYRLHGDDVGRSATFSADGKLLVTTGESSDAHVWNADSGASVAVLHGHSSFVVAASFNPAGTLVATAGSDGTARVWEAQDGASLLVLRGHKYLYKATFEGGGMLILTRGQEGIARVYRCDVCGSVDDLIADARTRLFGRVG
jgi:WD40 repeat protein